MPYGSEVNISALILHLHILLFLSHSFTHPESLVLFSLLAKEFKLVSGRNKYTGSLYGVPTVEKEKFQRNFWTDVSFWCTPGEHSGG